MHAHRHALTGVEPLCRQRSQQGQLFFQPLDAPLVALREQLTHKLLVVAAARKIAAATQQQGLVEGAFELAMALLHVAVLVRPRRVDGLASQTVVVQQALIALLKRVPIAAGRHGRR